LTLQRASFSPPYRPGQKTLRLNIYVR
jgi:hypothetical protein